MPPEGYRKYEIDFTDSKDSTLTLKTKNAFLGKGKNSDKDYKLINMPSE